MSPLEKLKSQYPWPRQRPAAAPSDRGWDGGGRDIITKLIASEKVRIILEIGAFVGLSTRQWLEAAPYATVICVDPWPLISLRHWGYDWPEVEGKQSYEVFLASCWKHRERIIPIQGTSPDMLKPIYRCGVQPDLIYVDGNHDYAAVVQDLAACHKYFPNAILTGDDWFWDKTRNPPCSVREAVENFAAANNFTIHAQENTWALAKQANASSGLLTFPAQVGDWVKALLGRAAG